MSSKRPFRLGICSESFAEDAIKRMLKSLELPFTTYIVKNVEYERTGLFDTLLFINPTLNKNQVQAFEKHVRNGTTAAILVSGDKYLHMGTIPLLKMLGIEIPKVQTAKKIKLTYTSSYPIAHKRGLKDTLTSSQKENFALFSFIKGAGPKKRAPLITNSTLFTELLFAVKIAYGNGLIIVTNSFSFSDDRAELIGYLMTYAREHKLDFFPAYIESIEEQLPTIINDSFQVYDEVPLHLIAKRAEIDQLILEEFDFILAVENLIREGKVLAKIQGDYLIKV